MRIPPERRLVLGRLELFIDCVQRIPPNVYGYVAPSLVILALGPETSENSNRSIRRALPIQGVMSQNAMATLTCALLIDLSALRKMRSIWPDWRSAGSIMAVVNGKR